MKILLVRHGESIGNITPNQDMPDSRLSINGIKQVEKMTRALEVERVQRIYSSPLVRALQTAQPLARKKDLQIKTIPELSEYREGKAHYGLTKKEIQEMFPEAICDFAFQNNGWFYKGNDNFETATERAEIVLEEILSSNYGETVLIVGHEVFNSFLIRKLLKIEDSMVTFTQKNTCINQFYLTDTQTTLQKFCSISHLEE